MKSDSTAFVLVVLTAITCAVSAPAVVAKGCPAHEPPVRPFTDADHAGIVGIEIARLTPRPSSPIVVVGTVAGTPAAKANVLAGDAIMAVDGVAVDSLDLYRLVPKIRGRIGTTVELTLSRGGKTVHVTLSRIPVPPHLATMAASTDIEFFPIEK